MNNKLIDFIISLPFLWLGTGLLISSNGDKNLVAIILISLVAILIKYKFTTFKENIKSPIIKMLIISCLYLTFSYFYHGISSTEIRTFIACTIFFLFVPSNILSEKKLTMLCAASSIISFIFVYYHYIHLSIPRANWPINAIPYSTVVATFSIVSLSILISTKSKNIKLSLIPVILLLILTLIITETRGTWLALIITCSFIATYNHFKLHKALNWKSSTLFVLAFLIALSLSHAQLNKRIAQTQQEYKAIMKGNLNTSIGLRLQMWSIAPQLISEQPIVGLGKTHINKINELYKEGEISKALYNFQPPHYHNQFIEALVKKGIIGLALLLLLILMPSLIIKKSDLNYTSKIMIWGISILFLLSSLTDVPLRNGSSLLVYFFLVIYPCIHINQTSKE
ncbi:O-antigen ligase family protein [Vibrio casei]|uniref:O-antigen ligase family protein n=1 Tax=Vibrio casei TaxID=673372 RepID=UPI003F950C80